MSVKKLRSLVLASILLVSFSTGSLIFFKTVYAQIGGSEEEFERNVIFEEGFDLGTWERRKEWDDNVPGKITAKVYLSMGRIKFRFPTTIMAKYNTTLLPFSTNDVLMSVEPYDGDDAEFRFTFGFNLSVTWETALGDATLGDFDRGIDIEGDWTPPIDGNYKVTSSESFTVASIGLTDLLSVDVVMMVRLKIFGYDVTGTPWENDDFAEIVDTSSPPDVELHKNYATQFGVKDTDIYTHPDFYVDFGANDLMYNIGILWEAGPTIGFSIPGASWTWPVPVWIPVGNQPLSRSLRVNNEDSDDTSYQMSGFINPFGGMGSGGANDFDAPIFDVGAQRSILVEPLEDIMVTIPIRQIASRFPVNYEISDTTMDIYYENGTFIKTITVTPSNFASEQVTTTLTIPSMDELKEGYNSFKFALTPPEIKNPPQYSTVQPPPPPNGTLPSAIRRADLEIIQLTFSVNSTHPTTGSQYIFAYGGPVVLDTTWMEIETNVNNTGNLPSTPTFVKLWLYIGFPTIPLFPNIEAYITASSLIGTQPLRSLNPGETQSLTFLWGPVPPVLQNQYVMFIAQVEKVLSETAEEDNIAATTAYIMNTSRGMRGTYWIIYSSFQLLDLVHGSPTAFQVASMAEEAFNNPTAYTEPEVFMSTMATMAEAELVVADEVTGKVSSEKLDQYVAYVTELSLAITEFGADENYTQLEIIRVIHLQIEATTIVDMMWSGALMGFTLDDSTGEAISGVEVVVSGLTSTSPRSTHTDINGFFNFTRLCPGQYNLSLTKSGYQDATQTANVAAEGITNINILLTSITGSLEVNVTDQETGLPIETALVSVTTLLSEGFESGTFAGWDFYYSTNQAQSGSIAPGTWDSSIVSGASALSGSYSARLFADSDASVAPWRVDAAINRTTNLAGDKVLRATLKFDNIQETDGAGHSYFVITVYNALNISRSVSYGFSTTGNVGNIQYTVNPGDLIDFEGNASTDYFNMYGETLPNKIMIRLLSSADYAEAGTGRRTTDVRIDDIEILGPIVELGVTTDGSVSFDKLLPGNYTILVEKEYYLPATTVATIYSQTATSLQIALTPELHDIAIVDIATSKTVASNITHPYINVTIENQGDFTATFYVSLYYNMNTIGTHMVLSLASGNTATLVYAWNTTDVTKGIYTIRAYASIIPGEKDTADNAYEDGTVIVAMPCDIAGSTTTPPAPPDGKVDYKDIFWLLKYYGKTDP